MTECVGSGEQLMKANDLLDTVNMSYPLALSNEQRSIQCIVDGYRFLWCSM